MNNKALLVLPAALLCLMTGSASVYGATNYVPNGDFEVGYGHGFGYTHRGRDYSVASTWDKTTAHHGKASMKVPAGASLVSRVLSVPPKKTYTLSVWVKPVSLPASIKLGVYNGNKKDPVPEGRSPVTYLEQNARELKDGWQQVKISGELTDFPSNDFHVRVSASETAGVWVDELQLIEGDPAEFTPRAPMEVGLLCDKPCNIFVEGEKVAMPLLACNASPYTILGKINYEVYDYLNRKVKSGVIDARVDGKYTWQSSLDLDTGKRGVFRVVLWVDGMDGTEEEVCYSVVAKPRVEGADPTSAIGIHASVVNHILDGMQRLGIKWQRSLSPEPWFRWELVEKEQGKFLWYDEIIRRAVDHNYQILGCIHGWAPWALKEMTPEAASKPAAGTAVVEVKVEAKKVPYQVDLDAWENYVYTIVNHYKGSVHYWEVCNEPIHSMKPESYVEIFKRARRAILKADPKAKIVGMGGSYGADWQLDVIKCLGDKPKDFMNFASTHLYPPGADPLNPSHDTKSLDYHDRLIVPYQLEYWNTETGAWCGGLYQGDNSNFRCEDESPDKGNKSLDTFFRGFHFEAERVVYNYMHTMGNGMTRYFYYDARTHAGPDYYPTHCTFMQYDDTIRTKGIAYGVLAWLFDHSKGLGNLTTTSKYIRDPKKAATQIKPDDGDDLGGDIKVYAYLFDRGGVPLVGIWSSDVKNRTLTLNLDIGKFKVYDMMGNDLKLTSAVIPFGRIPVYIEGQGGISVEQMKTAVQKGKLTETRDTTPPNLSISQAPRGQITDTSIRVRWIAIDDTYVPKVKGRGDRNAVLYSYRLVGRDTDWSDWSPTVVVYYKNLTAGPYRLEVKAKDGEGNTCEPVVREFKVVAER